MKRPTGTGLIVPTTGASGLECIMAELDMSWVTEEQVVEDTFERRDESEFETFDI